MTSATAAAGRPQNSGVFNGAFASSFGNTITACFRA
jgi:hypothetical protein